MVAISLYRGNLHRVPNVQRKWLIPTPTISLKDFRILLNRRSRALARLHSPTPSNPNPNVKNEEENPIGNDVPPPDDDFQHPPHPDPPKIDATTSRPGEERAVKEEVNERDGLDGGGASVKPVDGCDASRDVKLESGANSVDANGDPRGEKAPEILENLKAEETSNKVDALTDKEKRKKEVEDKLQVLNEKKHNLVQVLKQILSAEEELKRRNSMQGTGIRPSVPLQGDATNDSGSLTRIATPRMNSEGNLGGDMEGAEADDASNHTIHSRHLLQMSSISPHSDSPHRRPVFSAVISSSPSSSKLGRFWQSFALCSLRTPPCKSANSLCIRNKLHCLLPIPCSIRQHFFVQRCQTSQSMELEAFCFLNELFFTAETAETHAISTLTCTPQVIWDRFGVFKHSPHLICLGLKPRNVFVTGSGSQRLNPERFTRLLWDQLKLIRGGLSRRSPSRILPSVLIWPVLFDLNHNKWDPL
ncbi:hypothetical protein RHSIM_Rhsim12G0160300 [Rhododendron simsii]|uniref:Uncharacterized protein n=1 Tax=Rhododendron simsii TaxID=118357 RepID=A0A834G9M5_RHOSS|nr:hypothetical protein RHSIM_Rhsim12G0160300 [Rhododendron simsii]